MSAYNALARWYDRLTEDVSYSDFADFYVEIFSGSDEEISLILDLCCGTGSLSYELALRGYDLIACDSSPDMLAVAQEKCCALEHPPLFICQDAAELDLYGTVDAAVCSLDSINYISPEKIDEIFRRLSLFIRPHGFFIFDVKTPELLKSVDGHTYIDEDDSVFCVWRADWSESANCLVYGMDIFSKTGSLWRRENEEHIEYAYDEVRLRNIILEHGFELIDIVADTAFGGHGRQFYLARRT